LRAEDTSRSPGAPSLMLALAGAFLSSLFLFATAPLLLREEKIANLPPTYPVALFLPEKQPPPPEKEKQPPPSPPPPQLRVSAGQVSPLPVPSVRVDRPRLELNFSPSLSLAPALPAPVPPARGLASGELDRQPMLARRVPPIYPLVARHRGLQGAVTVRFLVDRQGKVQTPQILKADPPGIFEEAVLNSVSAWLFQPGIKDGRKVESWVETTIRFTLEGK